MSPESQARISGIGDCLGLQFADMGMTNVFSRERSGIETIVVTTAERTQSLIEISRR
jgi:hypothetical protein